MVQANSDPAPLLPDVARGDADATRECIDRYGPLVWSLARRMSGDPTQMEDAVQEIFIELWKSAERYDPSISAESTFVATIARRRLIDATRRAGRRPSFDALEDDRGAEDRNLDRLEISEEAARTAEVIERLKPEQQKVLMLSVRDGLTHGQIASFMSLPLGTVKSHIRRGLERVTRALTSSVGPTEEVAS